MIEIKREMWFEYYTFLHHSQTPAAIVYDPVRLNTIRFYIILKPRNGLDEIADSLNTIRFYIILKPQIKKRSASYTQNL